MSHTIEQFKKKFQTIKLIPCLKVNESIMNGIENEVREIIKKYERSKVAQKKHATNWTEPYGEAIQYSLYNTTRDTTDFSTDHNHTQKDKIFFDTNYINIYKIFNMFKHSILNLRLNGMGWNSGLSPHKEYNILGNKYKLRFHLPVITNSSAWSSLDIERFRLKRGIIYFFNNGCIHDAGNEGKNTRYHLVWDAWLDSSLYDKFLNVGNPESPFPEVVSRIPKEMINELLHSESYELERYVDEKFGPQKYDPNLEKIRLKIFNLYREILEREPDKEGLEYWSNKMLNDNMTLQAVKQEFYNSPEYEQLDPAYNFSKN